MVCIQFILNIYSTMVVLRAHHCLRRPSGGPAGGYCRSSADPVACGAPRASAAKDRCTFLACGALCRTNESKGLQPRRCCAPQARKGAPFLCRACARRAAVAAGGGACRRPAAGDGEPGSTQGNPQGEARQCRVLLNKGYEPPF